MGTVRDKMQLLKLKLPDPAEPAANYLPFVNMDGLVYISGQLPFKDGKIHVSGKVGQTLNLQEGQKAARLCTLHLLSQLNQACEGNLDRVQRCIRLAGYICCTDDFTEHSSVMNEASDLICELFQERGKHARLAIGVSSLPLGSAVEIEGLFSIV